MTTELTKGMQALKARRYAEADRVLTGAIASRATAEAHLLRSAAREKLGQRAGARDDLLAAARTGATQMATIAVTHRVATRLSKLGAVDAAIHVLDEARSQHDRDELARMRATLCLTSGRTHEGLATMRGLAGRRGDHALTLARWLHGFGDAEGALEALRSAPAGPERDRQRMRALVDVGDRERARGLLSEVTTSGAAEARLAIEIGDFDEARRRLATLVERDPRSVEAWAALADLALWRGDVAEAGTHVERIAALEPDGLRARRQRGIALALSGRRREALAAFDAALAIDEGDPEALLWRGELRRAEHDHDGSLRDLDAGITASHGYPIAGHLSRLLTVTAAHRDDGRPLNTTHEDAFAELIGLLQPMLGTVDGGLSDPLLDRLAGVLDAMKGNRTTRPTFVRGGELIALDVPIHTRFAARQIQDLLVARTPDDVVRRLERLAQDRGDEPTIHCHIGEIHLWVGNADRADAAFRRAIADTPEVRWAYVGLCAAEMIRGRWDEALAWCDRGIAVFPPPGRTMFAYRGEIHRRRGELERAEEDLRHMLELTPERMSSWINLALVRRERGDTSLLSPTFLRLRRRAPGLVDDGCRELSIDALRAHDDETLSSLFEHLLVMMRGNRSSNFVSYYTTTEKGREQLRFVPRDLG